MNSSRNHPDVVVIGGGMVGAARGYYLARAGLSVHLLERSPCGTGTSARMAQLHARGELPLGRRFIHESIIGSLFQGELVEETRVAEYPAVVPTIRGRAYITGFNTIVVDPDDPFPRGFLLG